MVDSVYAKINVVDKEPPINKIVVTIPATVKPIRSNFVIAGIHFFLIRNENVK